MSADIFFTPSFRSEATDLGFTRDQRCECPSPRARNPVITDGGLLDSGLAARSQVYAGCVNLPASAPRNDKLLGIDALAWRAVYVLGCASRRTTQPSRLGFAAGERASTTGARPGTAWS